MRFSLVVAMSRGGVIGSQGGLPWRLPRDLKQFRQLTLGKPIIMGRKTYESLGRPLPDRTNIILTRHEDFQAEGCLVARTKEEAIARARQTNSPEVMIIGGSQVYRVFLPLCDTVHLTSVKSEVEGDVTFPEQLLDSPLWEKVHEEEWPADARNPHHATYFILQRRQGA
jgi:dihydrofolate reductase